MFRKGFVGLTGGNIRCNWQQYLRGEEYVVRGSESKCLVQLVIEGMLQGYFEKQKRMICEMWCR